jgi:hypothetical protein
MVASVVLHASPPEIGGFLRIGHTGHREFEALLAANRLHFRRFVFDAPQALAKAMLASKKRLVNLRDTLSDLHATDSRATRSSVPTFRGDFINFSSAAGGRK